MVRCESSATWELHQVRSATAARRAHEAHDLSGHAPNGLHDISKLQVSNEACLPTRQKNLARAIDATTISAIVSRHRGWRRSGHLRRPPDAWLRRWQRVEYVVACVTDVLEEWTTVDLNPRVFEVVALL